MIYLLIFYIVLLSLRSIAGRPHEKLADFLRGELLPAGFFLVGVPLFCGDAALLMGYRWIYLSKPGILNTTIE